MRRKSFGDMNCSVAQSLEIVGEWWTMLIVRDCLFGVTRFDDFQRRLGIARNVLSQRLDHLVGHGVLRRVPYRSNPVRHEYRLTEKGRDLWKVVNAMREWGDRWEAVDGAPVVVEHTECGHPISIEARCEHCDTAVDVRSVRAVPGPGARRRPAAELEPAARA